MKIYIANLVQQMIEEHDFHGAYINIPNPDRFIEVVSQVILVGYVSTWPPEKLGEVMCLLDLEDVGVSTNDISKNVPFAGDPKNYLQELLSFFFAHLVCDRLTGACERYNLVRYKKEN